MHIRLFFLLIFFILLSSCEKEEEFNEDPNDFPSYLEGSFSDFYNSIVDIKTSESSLILFATDLHYSFKRSGYNVSLLGSGVNNIFKTAYKLIKIVDCDLFVLGGDYMQLPMPGQGQSKEMGLFNLEQLNRWMGYISCPVFPIIGNHELNYAGTGEGFGLTYEEFYSICQKQYTDTKIVKNSSTNFQLFYRDDISMGIRHIFLNTGAPDYSMVKDDLANLLKSTPEQLSVIIYNHFTGADYTEGKVNLYDGVKECLDIVDNSGIDFIAWIGGHNHADMCYTYRNKLVISCLQSGFWTSGCSQDGLIYEHVANSSNESALSAFIIRKDLGKIFLKRFGLGCNREFNYNSVSGNVGFVSYENTSMQ